MTPLFPRMRVVLAPNVSVPGTLELAKPPAGRSPLPPTITEAWLTVRKEALEGARLP